MCLNVFYRVFLKLYFLETVTMTTQNRAPRHLIFLLDLWLEVHDYDPCKVSSSSYFKFNCERIPLRIR